MQVVVRILTICFATLVSYFAYQLWFNKDNENEEVTSEKEESAIGSPPAVGKKKSATELIKDMETEVAKEAAEAAQKDSVSVALPATLPVLPKKPPSEKLTQPKEKTVDPSSAARSECLSSPKAITPNVMRIHQCYCRTSGKSRPVPDNEYLFDEKIKPRLLPTEIHPISYTTYKPIRLIDEVDGVSNLSQEVLVQPKKEKDSYLTVFNPVLHAISYCHQHALLLEELISNKDFYDTHA